MPRKDNPMNYLSKLLALSITSISFQTGYSQINDSANFHYLRTGIKFNTLSYVSIGVDFKLMNHLSAEMYVRYFGIDEGPFTGAITKSNVRFNIKYHIHKEKTKRKSTFYILAGLDIKHQAESGYYYQSDIYTSSNAQMTNFVYGIGVRSKMLDYWIALEKSIIVSDNSTYESMGTAYKHLITNDYLPTFYPSFGVALYFLKFKP